MKSKNFTEVGAPYFTILLAQVQMAQRKLQTSHGWSQEDKEMKSPLFPTATMSTVTRATGAQRRVLEFLFIVATVVLSFDFIESVYL